jgi:hypothetical protein
MKKEILIAIIIGFVLGLVITFGIWTANKSLKEGATTQPKEVTENETITTPVPAQGEEKLPLTLISPENNALVNQEKLEIVGKTSPKAVVAVVYEEGEKIIEADEKGDFKQEITLVGGGNEITISAFDNEGNEVSKTLNLVYSTAEI